MIRSELLTALAQDNPELRAEEVEQVVDIFFEEIAQRLAEGGRVELRGFGAFSTREREARKIRALARIENPPLYYHPPLNIVHITIFTTSSIREKMLSLL